MAVQEKTHKLNEQLIMLYKYQHHGQQHQKTNNQQIQQ